MSDSDQKTMGADEAYQRVFHGVHKRAFLHRLGQHGIVPQTEKEASDLLEIGAKVVLASGNQSLQQAAAEDSRFTKANEALDTALSELGVPDQNATQKQANGLSQEAEAAAWDLAKEPELYASVEVLKQAQEEQVVAAAGESE
jgi:hypothetical protein